MQSLDHPNIIRLYGVVLTQPLKMVRLLQGRKMDIFCCLQGRELPVFCIPLGDRVGPHGFTLRHAALASVRVSPSPSLALCCTNRVWHGLPGGQEVDSPGPGSTERAAGVQRDCEDWGLWADERTEPGGRPLHNVGTQEDPICVVSCWE